MKTGKLFRDLRELCSISQLEVAKRSGLSNGMICRFEKGRHDITLANLKRLMVAINRPVSDLFNPVTTPIKVYDQSMLRTLGTIEVDSSLADCYAIFINENEILPKNTIAVIKPTGKAHQSDIVSYIDNQGRVRFEVSNGGKYSGIVVKADWSYTRKGLTISD